MSTTTEPTIAHHPIWCGQADCERRSAGAHADVVHRGAEHEARFAHPDYPGEAVEVSLQLTRAEGTDSPVDDVDLADLRVYGDGLLTVAQLEDLGAWLLARAQEYRGL